MRADSIVLKTIKEHELISESDVLLLGLSGGPDSLCLLDILSKLQSELSFKLYALHVNHQIRGAEADADMQSAVDACKQREIPVTVRLANIPEIAKCNKAGEEETGRKIRQYALSKKAKELENLYPGHNVKIVLAHNKDDQAETVLMRILRGTGVHGLGAMEYKRDDGLIRPLLDVPRSLVEEYCNELGLKPCIDSSNHDCNYTRNRMRLVLLPLIESEFNPNIKDGLVRLADSAREDDACLNRLAESNMPELQLKLETPQPDWNSMPRAQLCQMDPAVAKRVIKMMFARVGLTQDIGAVHMNKLLTAADSLGNSVIEFPKGYKAYIDYDKISFRSPEVDTPQNDENRPAIKVSCLVVPIEEWQMINEPAADICALDALRILDMNSDLYVRTRRPGDRIKPLHGNGSKKLQDYMTDLKIPKEQRDKIKLLCCDKTVLWVKGYTISDLCRIDEETQFVLVTKIEED